MLDKVEYLNLVNRIGSNKSNIVIIENFLNLEDFKRLIDIKNSILIKDYIDRVYCPYDNLKEDDQKFILSIADNIKEKINNKFLVKSYIESGPIIARHPKDGYSLPEHKDDKEISPLHYFASIVYINDDYSGGEIYFNQYNKTLKPKENSLIFFPGNENYLHGVNECYGNDRFSLSTFYCVEKIMIPV